MIVIPISVFWLIVFGLVLVLLAGLSSRSEFWVWYRKAFDARGDEKRNKIRGRLYYYWADGKMGIWSYVVGVVGLIIMALGGLLP